MFLYVATVATNPVLVASAPDVAFPFRTALAAAEQSADDHVAIRSAIHRTVTKIHADGARRGGVRLRGLRGVGAPAAGERAVAPIDRSGTFETLVEAHNREREKAGKPPLEPSERLTTAAQRHADDMASRRRMTHRGGDGSSPFRRMANEGYRFARAGENVAAGQQTPDSVMKAWMTSPGHRRNILGNYTEIGAACATDEAGTPYWCVTFGTPEGH